MPLSGSTAISGRIAPSRPAGPGEPSMVGVLLLIAARHGGDARDVRVGTGRVKGRPAADGRRSGRGPAPSRALSSRGNAGRTGGKQQTQISGGVPMKAVVCKE